MGGGAVYSREDQQKWFAEMGMNWKENPEETGMEKSGGNRNGELNSKTDYVILNLYENIGIRIRIVNFIQEATEWIL